MRINLNELRQLIIEAILNAYDVLGVPHNATEEQIKAAWRKLAIQNHPDRGGSHGKMVDINNAKDRLLNKTDLFRYGANFKGYDDPNAPKPAASAPPPAGASADADSGVMMYPCHWCGRRVAFKRTTPYGPPSRRAVGHYTREGGNVKCEGSGKRVWDRPEPPQAQRQPPPPPPRNNPNDWGPSRSRPGYEYNSQTGEYRRSANAPPPPGPRPGAQPPPPTGAPAGTHRYFTYIGGRSRKFWEIERVGPTLYVRYGRLGTPGKLWTKTYASVDAALRAGRGMIANKLARRYVEGNVTGRTRPSQGQAAPPAAGAPGPQQQQAQQAAGRRTKDSYKVYGWRQGRRVVRVGGQLFGTQPGGRWGAGGANQSRFNANDRARVSRTADGKMKVQKTDSDYSQTWDPIAQGEEVDEVRRTVDELVLEMIQKIAESE